MKKVITYGTYDLLHYGHIRLLKRAKALGDYLIVGVTSDDFDKTRGKINVQQSLMERVAAVKATGIADEIIVEEYEGQKIDDIRKYDVDIFTVGSDWIGKFDYLNEYCEVVYLSRTEGVSSSELREQKNELKLGLVGESSLLNKIGKESSFVNGIKVTAVYTEDKSLLNEEFSGLADEHSDYDDMLSNVDAVYVISHPSKHYNQIKKALQQNKHVICESPVTLNPEQTKELFQLAEERECVLMEGIKTAFSTAYTRLILMAKSGKIGKIISVDSTCTSLVDYSAIEEKNRKNIWNSICAWGPTAMLPVFQLLGTNYSCKHIISSFADERKTFDNFTKIDFVYSDSVATIKVGKGVKSEGELIISGTKGYIYVPAPWWKTDYFEIRYENPADNKRYFYQLDGEGIRYELVTFLKSIEFNKNLSYISSAVTSGIAGVMADFEKHNDMLIIE